METLQKKIHGLISTWYLSSLVIRKYKLNHNGGITISLLELKHIVRLQYWTAKVGKNIIQLELSYIANRSVKYESPLENCLIAFYRLNIHHMTWPFYFLIFTQRNENMCPLPKLYTIFKVAMIIVAKYWENSNVHQQMNRYNIL